MSESIVGAVKNYTKHKPNYFGYSYISENYDLAPNICCVLMPKFIDNSR